MQMVVSKLISVLNTNRVSILTRERACKPSVMFMHTGCPFAYLILSVVLFSKVPTFSVLLYYSLSVSEMIKKKSLQLGKYKYFQFIESDK